MIYKLTHVIVMLSNDLVTVVVVRRFRPNSSVRTVVFAQPGIIRSHMGVCIFAYSSISNEVAVVVGVTATVDEVCRECVYICIY